MCGIVAVTSDVDVAPALRALAHRGPDGSGTWRAPGIALGHTRLAVVDPEHGAQPIVGADGSIVAVVNGEIYDTFDVPLRTRCDSELVVHLYERYGDAFVEKIRGELAFVLWDAKRRRLVAGRDRFGIKPLVWARHAGGIAIASEAKALFALGVPARWDAESWFHAAHTQYTWPDRTLFEGIHQLEPGCILVYDGNVHVRRYYRTGSGTSCTSRSDKTEQRRAQVTSDGGAEGGRVRAAGQQLVQLVPDPIRSSLEEAVRLRLRADAKVCVQLSGGLDSTTIAALARVPAFTVAFSDGGDYDERAIAERTARELEIPLTVVDVDANAIATHWPDAVAHGEGLAINGHLVGKYLLSRAMRDAGFKVALTGEGADELFAGYPHLRQDAGIVPDGHAASRGVMLPAGDALSTEGVRARLGFVPTWIAAKASLGARVHGLLAPDLVHAHADPYGTLIDRLGPLPPEHVSSVSWMKTALASYILRTLGDGMEMRHGIEGRVPFLDHHVVEAAFAIANHVDPAIDKPVLRAAVADLVPAHVRMRPKHPFLAPPLSRLAPALVQDTLRTHARRSSLVDGPALVGILDRLPEMSVTEQQQWDPALMLVLSGAILEAKYCR